MNVYVVSVRNVGSRKGFPYVAGAYYELTTARDGHRYYRPISEATQWCRSRTKAERLAREAAAKFPACVYASGVRYGSRPTA